MLRGTENSERVFRAFFIFFFGPVFLTGWIFPQPTNGFDGLSSALGFRSSPIASVSFSIQQQDTLEPKKNALLAKIDRLLGQVRNPNILKYKLTGELLHAAKELSELGDQSGYSRIKSYIMKMNWNNRQNLEFFDAISAQTYYRPDFTPVFFKALSTIPANRSVLYRACSMFTVSGDLYGEELDRYKPRYTRELLSAVARIEQALAEGTNVYDYTVKTCREALREHLLKTDLRTSFLDQYRHRLSPNEQTILNGYISIITPPDTDIPSLMFNEFMHVQWHREYSRWRDAHPSAECEAFTPGPYSLDLDEIWAYRCTSPEEERFRKRFYFYPDQKAEAIRLQKIRFSFPVTGVDVTTPLSDKFDDVLGPGEKPSQVQDLGSAGWSRIKSWNTPEYRMLLFHNSSRADWWNGLPQVEILARGNDLIRWTKIMDDVRWSRAERSRDSLKTDRLTRILAPHVPGIRDSIHQLNTHKNILNLIIKVMEFSPPDEKIRAAQLYLADELADKLMAIPYKANQLEQWEQTLSAYGVKFPSTHYGNYYNHAFMRRLLDENLSGYWSEETFLWGLRSGIFADPTEDPATFKKIIPQARKHLEQHPDTHIRDLLLLVLAHAYETGWNASQSSPHNPYVEDAPMYLQEAIQYYSMLLDEYPNHYYADAAKIKLRWLKLGLSTNHLYYYYIND